MQIWVTLMLFTFLDKYIYTYIYIHTYIYFNSWLLVLVFNMIFLYSVHHSSLGLKSPSWKFCLRAIWYIPLVNVSATLRSFLLCPHCFSVTSSGVSHTCILTLAALKEWPVCMTTICTLKLQVLKAVESCLAEFSVDLGKISPLSFLTFFPPKPLLKAG